MGSEMCIRDSLVTVRKVAPMGDPIEVGLRGYIITIRKEEAAKLTVEKVSNI